MGVYIPGAFKNKCLVQEKKEEEPIIVSKLVEKQEEITLVKPVEIKENVVWKKVKTVEEIGERKDEVKPIKYMRRDVYRRRLEYYKFLEDEWDNLWDIYDRMINYDEKFLDKARERDDDKCFFDLTKLVFTHLQKI
jgi:hypothetical protein